MAWESRRRPPLQGLCALPTAADGGRPFCRPIATIRCWCAGSTDWAARAVFTSDAKNRWAANWVTWPGFDKLWTNIFRDLLPHAPQSETTADFDRASNELVVDYRLSRNVDDPATIPDIFVVGPNGFQAPLEGRPKWRPATIAESSAIGQSSGAVPRAPGGRFARVSGSRLLPSGRRDAGVRQQSNRC